MGKGDHRSRRGKIYQGSFGKTRRQGSGEEEAPAARRRAKR